MKKSLSSVYIENTKTVNITSADIEEAENIKMTPEVMLRLADLIFLMKDEAKDYRS